MLRIVAVGRKNWLFAGSFEGARRAAMLYSIVQSCKLVNVGPFPYLKDVLLRLATHPHRLIDQLTAQTLGHDLRPAAAHLIRLAISGVVRRSRPGVAVRRCCRTVTHQLHRGGLPNFNASLDLDKHGSQVVDEPLEADEKVVPASFAARVRAQDRDTAMAH
jgi:IS66 C-terminal element